MMSIKNILISSSLFILVASLAACNKYQTAGDQTPSPDSNQQQELQNRPATQSMDNGPVVTTLPVRYQTPTYMVGTEEKESIVDEEATSLKVGASIRSTRGPQPLWDIVKRLAALKRMNVSWASDVDQNVLVDVDINANDDFYEAIDNLLRQVDYYHEMEGSTIVVKYKETRKFQIAMPFTKQSYSTGTGGNLLGGGGGEIAGDVDGTIQLKSTDNQYDIWKNIQDNMDAIIRTWNTKTSTPATSTTAEVAGESAPPAEAATSTSASGTEPPQTAAPAATQQVSFGDSMYIIDKPIGLITVSAPRPLLERLDTYFKSLKEELYKQISIEAKIIEVQLDNASSIGINWSAVLKDFPVNGTISFGDNGQVYPSAERFVSSITLDPSRFNILLNALKEQGDTKVLSNPKISVMNGQPALITVGRNVTYIDSIESSVSGTGIDRTVDFTVNTERILSGIGMALTATILDEDQIIMNLVPVTSELVEPIENFPVGDSGGVVGLPIVNVREMSTTVKVKDGEMLVIGGLISNSDDSTGEFAPVVGDIPFLRYLFGHEKKVSQKRELIILLRPRII